MDIKQPKIRVYLRVSTEKQDEGSQRHAITEWLRSQGIDFAIVEWFAEKESGTKVAWENRKISAMLDESIAGDKILVTELNRIARNTVGVRTFVDRAVEKNIEVIAIREGMRIDGSPSSNMIVGIMASLAEMEAATTARRTKTGMQARKNTCAHGAEAGTNCGVCGGIAEGRPIGRQPGAKGKNNKLSGREEEIHKLLGKGIGKSATAKIFGVSRQTLDTFLKTNAVTT